MAFILNSQLANECIPLMELDLCTVLLLRDANFPRLVLVPRVPGATELFDLSQPQQAQLMQEISEVSKRLKTAFEATKINVGSMGNMVSQLHIHIVARFEGDPCWPRTMWDYPKAAYPDGDLEDWIAGMKKVLGS
ncbi:HIT family protein [Temperatibacter marinus]|uniref:HIT family protein n=1 Tax=Temperatibacter marinus TaxID=1456591 RepID=A0AA52HA92_9PROT|nr:HIT family protein [Temperatibacter marinus]WND03382.1 HIT family protein [Temperatibacter marinus]